MSTVSSFAKSKEFAKIKEENLKAINSSQINEERVFRVHFLVEGCCIVVQ